MGNIEFARSVLNTVEQKFKEYLDNPKLRSNKKVKEDFVKYYNVIFSWARQEQNNKEEYKKILQRMLECNLNNIQNAKKKAQGYYGY